MSGEESHDSSSACRFEGRESPYFVGVESREIVSLEKGHGGIGIHIRGGLDFPFIKNEDLVDPGIFIVHISENGYAQKDGRLRVSLPRCRYQARERRIARSDSKQAETRGLACSLTW